MDFNPADFKPVKNAAPAPAADGFNASDFVPVDQAPIKAPAGGGDAFFDPTKTRVNQFINNDSESVDAFADRKAKQGIFGIGALTPATGADFNRGVTQDAPGQQDWGVLGGFKIPLKTAANVLSDVPNLVADVGNFAWQTFAHPIDTLTNIARDPLGFAEGMVGDLITQPLSGMATGIKDLVAGKGLGKAGEDTLAGFQKGLIAFVDRPITSIIQLKLAKGLATDPVGTVKTVAKDTIDMGTKPWQAAYKFAKDPKQAVVDVANAVQNKYDAIKNIPTFFTKEGQAKIAQGMGNQVMEYAQNNLKMSDLQEKLKSLDINSKEYTQTKAEMNIAQQKIDNAQKSIDLLTSHFADKTGQTFAKGGYNDTSEFTQDANGVVDGMYKSKDYANALNPNGQPVRVSDVTPLTQFLRENGQKLESLDNPDGAKMQKMATDLELRQQINQAGGKDGFIEKQVTDRLNKDGISPESKPAAYKLAKEQYTQEATANFDKLIADKPSFYTQPITADVLHGYMTGKYEDMGTNFGRKIMSNPNDTTAPTSQSVTTDILNKELSKVDPKAPERLAIETKKAADLRNIWSKWSEKTFDNTGSMVRFITSEKNWADFQNFPQEVKTKFQNTLAAYIVDTAKNPDGTMNFNKLSSLTEEYKPNLTSNHVGALSELIYANSLPENVRNTPEISNDLKGIMRAKGELSTTEKQLTDNERQIENLKANMDVVGTTPEKIATNLKGIHTMDDLQSFMKAANIKDPRQLGDIITGTLYDQMQQQFGENKGINFESLAELVQQTRDIGKNSPLGEQLKNSLFSPEKQKALEVLEEQSQKLSNMFDSKGFTPGAKRLFHAAFGAGASVLGWHVTAVRNFFDAVKPDSVKESKTAPNEVNLKKMSEKKAPGKPGLIQRGAKIVPKAAPAAEGLNNVDVVPQWFKSEAEARGYDGDMSKAWQDFNSHIDSQQE